MKDRKKKNNREKETLFRSLHLPKIRPMSGSEGGSSGPSTVGDAQPPPPAVSVEREKKKEKARVSRTSLILWHTHQNDAAAVRKLLEEDRSLMHARDYDNRTPLHVAAIHGWIDVAKCLLEHEADVNAQDRWKNTPLADAEGAKRSSMIELLKSYCGLSYVSFLACTGDSIVTGMFYKCDWEIDPTPQAQFL